MDHLSASELHKLLSDEMHTLGGIRQKVMAALQELKVEESWLRNRMGESGERGNPHKDIESLFLGEVEGHHEGDEVEEGEGLEDFLQELEGRLQIGEHGDGDEDEQMRDDGGNEEVGSVVTPIE